MEIMYYRDQSEELKDVIGEGTYLIQEPTNLSEGMLLTPYDLYSKEVPKVQGLLPQEPHLKITVSGSSYLTLYIDY